MTDISGFTMNDSNESLHDRVAFVIDRIRPAVQDDGGDIEFVEVTDAGIVKIKMHGACVGCPSSDMTLRIGIERNLKDRIPEVTAYKQLSKCRPTNDTKITQKSSFAFSSPFGTNKRASQPVIDA